jgi:hypothetical protein
MTVGRGRRCGVAAARRRLATLLACFVMGSAMAPPAFGANDRMAGIWLPDASRSQRLRADAPYTARGRRIVEEWRESHDPIEDDPGRFCQAPGMPSLALGGADYPLEIIITPAQVTILMELHQQVRRVFMNVDSHPERVFPQRNGHSIGRWDDNTLVVDTIGIRAITYGSVPHSEQVHVVERWRVIDDGASLVNELTITDPIMFAEPIVLRQYYTRAPAGTRMLEYECTEGMWREHERARERAAER